MRDEARGYRTAVVHESGFWQVVLVMGRARRDTGPRCCGPQIACARPGARASHHYPAAAFASQAAALARSAPPGAPHPVVQKNVDEISSTFFCTTKIVDRCPPGRTPRH
jgi:hypothetical protein